MTQMSSLFPRMQSELAKEIHLGLYDAWLLMFRATGSPYNAITPEYAATVMVANRICETYLQKHKNLRLHFEQRAHKVASACFSVPPFPRRKRNIPARKTGKKGDRERIDITIQDEKDGVVPVTRHIVELKISTSRQGLRDDLIRNRRLLELEDERTKNCLESAFLGFVIVDSKAAGQEGEVRSLKAVEKRYKKFLNNEFRSPKYEHYVTVETLSPAPEPDEVDGEFRLFMSVVIAFERLAGQ